MDFTNLEAMTIHSRSHVDMETRAWTTCYFKFFEKHCWKYFFIICSATDRIKIYSFWVCFCCFFQFSNAVMLECCSLLTLCNFHTRLRKWWNVSIISFWILFSPNFSTLFDFKMQKNVLRAIPFMLKLCNFHTRVRNW